MNYAQCYEAGVGVPKDLAEADRLMEQSAEMGFAPAKMLVDLNLVPSQMEQTREAVRLQRLQQK